MFLWSQHLSPTGLTHKVTRACVVCRSIARSSL